MNNGSSYGAGVGTGVAKVNLLIGGVIMIYLEYRNNPNEFNIKGIRYIFTSGR